MQVESVAAGTIGREEFDAQARMLARTREKLESLEQRLAALESTGENAN